MGVVDDILSRTSPDAIKQRYGADAILRRSRERVARLTGRSADPASTSLEDMPTSGLKRMVVSGLSRVGNLLDLPGSMVRDYLAGQNPFDQLLSPTTSENRTTGRDLLRRNGMVGSQDNWGNFWGGIGTEILTDPLTYLTFGGSALTKAGTLAKRAGIAEHALNRAVGTIPSAAQKVIGPRTFRANTTLAEAMKLADETLGGAGKSLERLRQVAPDEAIQAAMGQKLGGNIGLNIPFLGVQGDMVGSVGARALDRLGNRLKASGPVRAVTAGFSHAVRGDITDSGQRLARDFTARETEALSKARGDLSTIVEAIGKAMPDGVNAEQSSRLYQYLEGRARPGGASVASPTRLQDLGDLGHLAPELDKLGKLYDDLHGMERMAGLNSHSLDDLVSYAARIRQRFPSDKAGLIDGSKGRGFDVYSTTHPHQIKRSMRGIEGGTATLQKISQDARYSGVHHSLDPAGRRAAKRSFLRDYAAVLPGRNIADPKEAAKANSNVWSFVSRLDPRHSQEGIAAFVHNPAEAALRRIEHGYKAVEASNTIRDSMIRHASVTPGSDTTTLLTAATGMTKKKEGFRQLRRLTPEGASRYVGALPKDVRDAAIASLKKVPTDPFKLDKAILRNIHVPRELAENANRLTDSFSTPEVVTAVGKAVDWLTNTFKTSVTSLFPAFHFRNFVSGQYQNFIGGALDARSVPDAHRLLTGKAINGASKIRGIAASTDMEATRKLAQEAWANGIQGSTGYISDMAGKFHPSPFRQIPGADSRILPHARDFKSASDLVRPRQVGTEFRPQQSWIPGAVATDVGNYVEGVNRLSAFIALRRKGFTAQAAAQRVKALHVDYGALSLVERKVMKRLFPFYSFTRGTMPFTLEELLQRPGGRLGNTLRAVERGRDKDSVVPDYVSDTAAIRLQDPASGGQRYFTGFGIMPEDPLSFLGGGVRGAGLEALSRMNPLIKGPLEHFTNQSYFQKTPFGGRPLEDLDPTIGRLIANIRDRMQGVPADQRTEAVRLPQAFETFMSNTPLSRALTTARSLTDRRRGPGEKALNTLTGFRTTIVSEAAQDAILRERATEMMRKMGAENFIRTYFPADDMARMSPENKLAAEKLMELMRRLGNRSKERVGQLRK